MPPVRPWVRAGGSCRHARSLSQRRSRFGVALGQVIIRPSRRSKSMKTQVALLLAALAAPAMDPALRYPATTKGAVVDDYNGSKVADPYRWLEDLEASATREWIEAENTVTFRYLEAIPGREAIRKRLTALWNYPRTGV